MRCFGTECDTNEGVCLPPSREIEFFIDNLLVRIHFVIEMIWWTGLAPRESDFPSHQRGGLLPALHQRKIRNTRQSMFAVKQTAGSFKIFSLPRAVCVALQTSQTVPPVDVHTTSSRTSFEQYDRIVQ